MKTAEYDEYKVLNEYLTHNLWLLMTDQERRTFKLAHKRELEVETNDSYGDRLPSKAGSSVLANQIRQRIQRDISAGKSIINRCPECNRIVRTPLARQCLWCGYDWHGT